MQNGSRSIKPFTAMRIACFCLILLLVVSLLSGQTFKLQRGQSVYVVAVSDSRLFTMCAGADAIVLPAPSPLNQSQLHVSYSPDGTQRIMIPESYSDDPFRVQDIGDERQVQHQESDTFSRMLFSLQPLSALQIKKRRFPI
jgi:hypothetical protein